MNILCRLGWHSWKEVWRAVKVRHTGFYWDTGELAAWEFDEFVPFGHKCRRCGVRK